MAVSEHFLLGFRASILNTKNEVAYEEKIAVLAFGVKDKGNVITRLTNQLDHTLKEKEDLKAKLEQFEISSKNLNKLINSQLSAKDKVGLGYGDQLSESDSEVPPSVFGSRLSDDNLTNDRFKKGDGYHAVPPLLTGNYMPPLADLSFAGLDDSVYRPTTNKASASISKGEPSVIKTSNISVEMLKVDSTQIHDIHMIKNPVYHSKTKHIEIRHHFIRDSYEKRLIEMVKIHTDNNVADLLTKEFDTSRDCADNDSSERPPSHDLYEVVVTRWRSKVAAVRTHTRMTARKEIMGLMPVRTPAHSAALCLAKARPSSHSSGSSPSLSSSSSDSSSSSSWSSSEGSSFDIMASSHERLSHPSTTHSTSGPLSRKRPQGSDYVTPSPSPSAGLSRKRCRSPATSVPSPAHTPGALSPIRADRLPPHKRFICPLATSSPEDSIEVGGETNINSDILANIEADTAAEAVANAEVKAGVTAKAEIVGDDEADITAEVASAIETKTVVGELAVVEASVGDDDEEDDGMEGDDQAGDESDAKVYVEADARAEPKENT
nr:putative ribonuclease H-like domain-containing protein [Tanacetum cinerariifolium]